jgi:hypothetical protein
MDVELEMVDRGQVARGGLVPAEDLEGDGIMGLPYVRRQNSCFLVLLVSFTLAMAIFVVGTVYLAPGENAITENEFAPGSGTVGSDSQEKMQQAFVSIANNKDHKDSGLEKWMKEHGVGGGEVTAGVNGTKLNIQHSSHGHSKVTAQGVKSHAIHNPNTAGGAAQNSGTESSGGDNAPPSASGDNAPPGISPEVAAWLATPVTLGDGVMYEIVDQLVHDNTAFTYVLLWHKKGHACMGLFVRTFARSSSTVCAHHRNSRVLHLHESIITEKGWPTSTDSYTSPQA